MRPAFGDWRSPVAHFVRDEGSEVRILYHRPNSKSLLNEQAFLHLQLMRMRTSGAGRFDSRKRENVAPATARRLAKSSITDQIRKACSTSRLFASAAHEDENLRGREVRLDVGLIRRVSVASGKCAGHCRMRRDRLIRPTHTHFSCQICAPYLTIH